MIIIENQVDLDIVVSMIPEAEKRFSALSDSFDKEEIQKIVENLAKSEPELAIAIGSLNESIQLNEFMVKHVNSRGEVEKKKDRKNREKQAFQTTGLSKSTRRQIARKAAKTKRANPSIQVRADRKRKKAMKKRQALGLS